jgi:NAD(P)-dependent dehydrogenase (short-subunit alcohol dehydrogenase family)
MRNLFAEDRPMKKRLWIAGGVGVALGLRRAFPSFRYAGKVVALTGGSRGLGLVMGRQLVRQGARLAICARDGAELERARAELASSGAEVLAVTCDVSDAAQADSFIQETVQRFGRIDVLINNAGIIQVAPFECMGLADFRQAMEINYFGTLHTTLAAFPHLREQRGRMINICSIGGAIAIPHLTPYTASKVAAVGLSEGLATECARYGISVSTILPFVMRTGSHVNALFKGQRENEFAWFSIGASTPGTSVSAERAARRILLAGARGERYVTIGGIAKLARVVHALLPGTVQRIASVVNRMLPDPAGAGPDDPAEPGWQHRHPVARGPFTRLADDAARRNREVPWAPPG